MSPRALPHPQQAILSRLDGGDRIVVGGTSILWRRFDE